MEYIYGILLLHRAGKPITEESLTKVMKAAGVNVDEAKVKAVVSAVQGTSIDEVLKSALVTPAVAPAPAPPAVEAPAQEPSPEKKEKKKEEEKKEEGVEGLAALFG